ncbi:MAG: polysaccharide deacetylase family protein [Candidatus Riflebacteria bacterium]|nr:polysaccharide deacetylase family protein [Candidatus Riflebacteria bacterium]
MKKIFWVIAGVLFLLAIPYKVSKLESFQFFGELVSRVETSEKIVSLTFDDGPTNGKTEEILAILKENEVRATFYLVGEAMTKNMDQTKLIVNQGHEIGNHSYSHQKMMLKGYNFVREEIDRTNELIRQAGYLGQVTFRAPYGRKLFVLPYFLQKNNIISVMWDVEPDSILPLDASPEELIDYAIENTKPGSIILMHVMFNSRSNSMTAIPGIIKGLKSRGYRFVTVSELINNNGEHNKAIDTEQKSIEH